MGHIYFPESLSIASFFLWKFVSLLGQATQLGVSPFPNQGLTPGHGREKSEFVTARPPRNFPKVSSFFFKILSWPCFVACKILIAGLGIKPVPPALRAWSLNHWTTGKSRSFFFFLDIPPWMWKSLNCDFVDLLTCIIAFRNPKKERFFKVKSLTNVLLAWGSAFLIYKREISFNPQGCL